MIQYPVKLEREGTDVLVAFPDFPHVHTFGADEDEALVRAVDALENIPEPSHAKRGQRTITLHPH